MLSLAISALILVLALICDVAFRPRPYPEEWDEWDEAEEWPRIGRGGD